MSSKLIKQAVEACIKENGGDTVEIYWDYRDKLSDEQKEKIIEAALLQPMDLKHERQQLNKKIKETQDELEKHPYFQTSLDYYNEKLSLLDLNPTHYIKEKLLDVINEIENEILDGNSDYYDSEIEQLIDTAVSTEEFESLDNDEDKNELTEALKEALSLDVNLKALIRNSNTFVRLNVVPIDKTMQSSYFGDLALSLKSGGWQIHNALKDDRESLLQMADVFEINPREIYDAVMFYGEGELPTNIEDEMINEIIGRSGQNDSELLLELQAKEIITRSNAFTENGYNQLLELYPFLKENSLKALYPNMPERNNPIVTAEDLKNEIREMTNEYGHLCFTTTMDLQDIIDDISKGEFSFADSNTHIALPEGTAVYLHDHANGSCSIGSATLKRPLTLSMSQCMVEVDNQHGYGLDQICGFSGNYPWDQTKGLKIKTKNTQSPNPISSFLDEQNAKTATQILKG